MAFGDYLLIVTNNGCQTYKVEENDTLFSLMKKVDKGTNDKIPNLNFEAVCIKGRRVSWKVTENKLYLLYTRELKLFDESVDSGLDSKECEYDISEQDKSPKLSDVLNNIPKNGYKYSVSMIIQEPESDDEKE